MAVVHHHHIHLMKKNQNLQLKILKNKTRIQQEQDQENQGINKPEESFVGPSIIALMSALPNASYFGLPSESVFNSEKLVTLFANLSNIPLQ